MTNEAAGRSPGGLSASASACTNPGRPCVKTGCEPLRSVVVGLLLAASLSRAAGNEAGRLVEGTPGPRRRKSSRDARGRAGRNGTAARVNGREEAVTPPRD